MTNEELSQSAQLHRQAGGMATAPDAPIWVSAGKVTDGPFVGKSPAFSSAQPFHRSARPKNCTLGDKSAAR